MIDKSDTPSLSQNAPGSAPVPGVGESVPLSRTSSEESSFRRDAETDARDGRAPQSACERLQPNETDL